jgi:hypothetical protein
MTNCVDPGRLLPVLAEQLAHAAPAQHGLRDQGGFGPVVTGLDKALQALGLHLNSPIGRPEF